MDEEDFETTPEQDYQYDATLDYEDYLSQFDDDPNPYHGDYSEE